jgi:hypothetical protein
MVASDEHDDTADNDGGMAVVPLVLTIRGTASSVVMVAAIGRAKWAQSLVFLRATNGATNDGVDKDSYVHTCDQTIVPIG